MRLKEAKETLLELFEEKLYNEINYEKNAIR